ncbi:hypothetical protein FNV43_RR10480 [Rhamnella rubrinervis]|uniref:Uncharacterized protein n=1 Tax=Rhamnella rubrinervis TaxID=2594499 RepID=A0A8K0MKT8_9ROSA|nr:hypothetical protein FNV43_RR10480 [Rhamnella rubrinervis]
MSGAVKVAGAIGSCQGVGSCRGVGSWRRGGCGGSRKLWDGRRKMSGRRKLWQSRKLWEAGSCGRKMSGGAMKAVGRLAQGRRKLSGSWQRAVSSCGRKLSEGRRKLSEGRRKLWDGRRKMWEAVGRCRRKFAEGRRKLSEGRRKLWDGRRKMSEGRTWCDWCCDHFRFNPSIIKPSLHQPPFHIASSSGTSGNALASLSKAFIHLVILVVIILYRLPEKKALAHFVGLASMTYLCALMSIVSNCLICVLKLTSR